MRSVLVLLLSLNSVQAERSEFKAGRESVAVLIHDIDRFIANVIKKKETERQAEINRCFRHCQRIPENFISETLGVDTVKIQRQTIEQCYIRCKAI